MRELGCGAKPAMIAILSLQQQVDGHLDGRLVDLACRRWFGSPLQEVERGLRRLQRFVAILTPCAVHGAQHVHEGGRALTRFLGEVRAAKDGQALRGENDRHGPTTAGGRCCDVLHVERVDVRAFLAVDFDRDEVVVEERSGRRITERLALHHMAPVA